LRLVDAQDAQAVASAVERQHADLANVLRGMDLVQPARLRRDAVDHAQWIQRTIRRHVRKRSRLVADDAGRMLLLVSDVGFRDLALAEMSREDAEGHVELWRDLVRRTPRDLLPAVSSLLAFAAWLKGHGALAWCALDRCFEVAPDHPLGRGLAECLTRAVPPSAWAAVEGLSTPESDTA
jgi:hypothetical protein